MWLAEAELRLADGAKLPLVAAIAPAGATASAIAARAAVKESDLIGVIIVRARFYLLKHGRTAFDSLQ